MTKNHIFLIVITVFFVIPLFGVMKINIEQQKKQEVNKMNKTELEELAGHIKYEKIVGVRHRNETTLELKLSNGKILELNARQDWDNEEHWIEAKIEDVQGWI